jgi:hypothetical protein
MMSQKDLQADTGNFKCEAADNKKT